MKYTITLEKPVGNEQTIKCNAFEVIDRCLWYYNSDSITNKPYAGMIPLINVRAVVRNESE